MPRTRRPAAATHDAEPLAAFHPATRAWFEDAFEAPTAPQAQGWPAIAAGRHTLICAPTGSGKTLAAFLWCLDRLMGEPPPTDPLARLRVLYVSPLKALVHDVDRNLRAPMAGIRLAAERLGGNATDISVGMRTGDTPAEERRAFGKHPPDILVTTPESLYLLLTSQAREALRSVRWVIVDEIHALAPTKRGAHLALSLERLAALTPEPPQRIGLSATQRPLEVVAGFLGGREPATGEAQGSPRPVTIVDAGVRKPLELEVVVPVEDMGRLGETIPLEELPGGPAAAGEQRTSIWPSVYPRILELIRSHRSTIVFANSRRLAERLALKLNELAEEDLVRAHHGSLAREQRLLIEQMLKEGRLPAIVATSSLELGIDMGAVDLVIQVESPLSVARGLQRIGRAGHQVGEPSKGVLFPKYRGDLLETAVVTRLMHEGVIEPTVVPHNPLDVLAQQIVAACVERAWGADELFAMTRGAENYASLGRETFDAVLGMLAGQYPSDEFAELKPRVVWDRVAGTLRSRGDARTVAVISGGTIPERGLFPVYLADDEASADAGPGTRARAARSGGRRVGELDEEMVYEAREGEVILLGASAWRIESIAHDRVTVTPAPGEPGKVPFWKGDQVGRPAELGREMGAFIRTIAEQADGGAAGRGRALRTLREHHDLDDLAARNLLAYLDEERQVTGTLPTDRTIVVQRFRDELGDWRVVLLSPFGARVHAPWCLAIEARLRERLGVEVKPIWSDDGIVIRLPASEVTPGWGAPGDGEAGWTATGVESIARTADDAVLVPSDEVEELVVGAVGSSALFASRFRENAARALLLPRRRPGSRTPLWQMRQRASQLLAVASRYGSFPIILETYRECLQDVFDLPALRDLLAAIERREVRVVSVETQRASPFASSLLFDYIASYMYEGDAPLADRRAQALTLDRDLLRELLGAEELRELFDADALAELELELQALTTERAAGSVDQVHDLLRGLGDLSTEEVRDRVRGADPDGRWRAASEWLGALAADRRAVEVRVVGERRWIATEDVARYRDGVGVAPPRGVPESVLGTTNDALGGLLARYARRHGPFRAVDPAARWGLPVGVVETALERLMATGVLVRGEFRPGGVEREWCDPEVLRLIRRRSLARLRREVEPVEPAALGRFLPAWQGVGTTASGPGRLAEVIGQLEGLAMPASVLERDILPARVQAYQPRMLDELLASGEVVWVGAGSLGRDDGRVVLWRADRIALSGAGSPGAAASLLGSAHAPLGPPASDDSSPMGAGEPHSLRPGADAAGPEPHASAVPGGGPPADAPVATPAPPEDEDRVRAAIVGQLENRGASFYREILAAVLRAAAEGGVRPPAQRELLDTLWDLVWGGTVTNDTFLPLRALRWPRGGRDRAADRPRLGATGRVGPPEGAGRWSLVSEAVATAIALAGGSPPSETERRHAIALRLLDRHGVVTRDAVAAEDVPGGFSAVYPILREMEDRGRVRRGYFVEGLGGAQFALPAAVDRLRAERPAPGDDRGGRRDVVVLAATDPANPYGAALPWPQPAEGGMTYPRAAGAYVVLADGDPVLYLERSGRAIRTFPAFAERTTALDALRALVRPGPDASLRRVRIERIDGEPVLTSPHHGIVLDAGFQRTYRGLVPVTALRS
ncbi:MAG: DEAD/DEAH box helicase [Candidatus Limnocylindrales bacterium]